ncbi:MAG: hypothetical protein ACREQA_19590 [Candidatus Binatia bacterium]
MVTYTESFTAVNGALQSTDTDLTWAMVTGGGTGWAVVSNEASPQGTSRGITNSSRAEHDTTNADHYAQFSIVAMDGAASECGPCVRFNPSATTYYFAMFRNAAIPWVQIWKRVAGTFTALGSQITVIAAFPDTLRIEVEGSTLRAYWNGVLTEEITDTSITSGTRGGIYGHEAAGKGLGVVIDSFEVGDLSPGTNLVVGDAAQTHSADAPSLTQVHALTVAEAQQSHSVDGLVLTQTHVLAVQSIAQDQTADNVGLSMGSADLVVQNASQGHSVDQAVLTQVHELVINSADQGLTSDVVDIEYVGSNLVLADASQGHSADSVALTQVHVLTVQDALHAMASTDPWETIELLSSVSVAPYYDGWKSASKCLMDP